MQKLKQIIIFTIINNIISTSIGLVIFFMFFEKYMIQTWLTMVAICVITVIIWIVKVYKILTKETDTLL